MSDAFRRMLRWADFVVRRVVLTFSIAWATLLATLTGREWLAKQSTDVNDQTLVGLVVIDVLLMLFAGVYSRASNSVKQSIKKWIWQWALPLLFGVFVVAGGAAATLLLRESLDAGALCADTVAVPIFFTSLAAILYFLFVRVSVSDTWWKDNAEYLASGLLFGCIVGSAMFTRDVEWLIAEFASFPMSSIEAAGLFFTSLLALAIVVTAMAIFLLWIFIDLPRFVIPGFVALVSTAAITYNLAPSLGWFTDQTRTAALTLGLEPGAAANTGCTTGDLGEGINAVLGTLLAAFSTVVVAVAASAWLREKLDRILSFFKETPGQRLAAQRIHLPASAAVSQKLPDLFPQEIRITEVSEQRHFPVETLGGTKSARIKLILRRRDSMSRRFDVELIRNLSQSARVTLGRALFFVVATGGRGADDSILCYGTGAELLDIAKTDAPLPDGRPVGGAFFEALNGGDEGEIEPIVREVRAMWLRSQPYRDLLLSADKMLESANLSEVMKRIAEAKLSRILLVTKEGFDSAIVGATEISKFLTHGRSSTHA